MIVTFMVGGVPNSTTDLQASLQPLPCGFCMWGHGSSLFSGCHHDGSVSAPAESLALSHPEAPASVYLLESLGFLFHSIIRLAMREPRLWAGHHIVLALGNTAGGREVSQTPSDALFIPAFQISLCLNSLSL